MSILFSGNAGIVARMDEPAAQCEVAFSQEDPKIDFFSERAIITRMTMSQQVNVQFLHTMGSLIYVYVFGDRIGQFNLSGLAFCTCDGSGFHGASEMYKWYKKYRSSKRAEPARLNMGSEIIEGFITGFNEDVIDPSISLVQWSLNMATLPEI